MNQTLFNPKNAINTTKKRVWNLYRVSTEAQVDQDDIPMQKNACRTFIESKPDWELTRELSELGVSGFKKSASQRDKLVTIKQGALNKEFDVLLVFMFDRLGRKEDDTPFFVQSLVKEGIEVWSVKEGQKTFDSHIDKLLNYMTFWVANGESDKTSMRVKEKFGQLNVDGGYLGGTAPYGYEIYDTGVKHIKKEKTVKALRINEGEATLVRVQFDLVVTKGYGASRIAQWLNDHGYKTRNGSSWRHNYVTRILRNSIVCGYKMYGYFDDGHIHRDDVKTQPFNADYVIMSKEIFDQVQNIVSGRYMRKDDGRSVFPTKSKLLLSGIVKCGYCGGSLVADYSQKSWKRKDGEVTKWYSFRYVCKHGKDKAHGVVHEVTQFGNIKYETQVENIVKEFLKRIDKETFVEEMANFRINVVNTKRKLLARKKKEIEEDYRELTGIKSLIVKVEIGQSRLSFETVEEMLINQEKKIIQKNLDIQELEKEMTTSNIEFEDYKRVLNELDDWEQRYDAADLDSKKMMMARIIKSLEFMKDEIIITLILPLENSIGITGAHNLSSPDSKRAANTLLYEETFRVRLNADGNPDIGKAV